MTDTRLTEFNKRILSIIAHAANDDEAVTWVMDHFAEQDCRIDRIHAVTYIVNARAQAQKETSE
jgi:hypothetical protein